MFYPVDMHIIYDWITIMGYSKHEISTVNILCSLKKSVMLHPYLPMAATSPQRHFGLSQGGRCGEVRLLSPGSPPFRKNF